MVGKFCAGCNAIALTLIAFASMASADEVIIADSGSSARIAVGDFSCSPCFSPIASASYALDGDGGRVLEITAGELWQFLDNQGYQSVNQLTLFLELDPFDSESRFNLSELNVQIQHPDGIRLLTDMGLGTDQLIVPGYETSSTRPEAEIRIELGYDFMKEFSQDSKEMVRVSAVSTSAMATSPRFLLGTGEDNFGSSHLGTIFGFILFWGLVFLVLLRCMKPANRPLMSQDKSNQRSSQVIA